MSGKTPEMKACPEAQALLNLVRECLGKDPIQFDARSYLSKIVSNVGGCSAGVDDWSDDIQELPFSEESET